MKISNQKKRSPKLAIAIIIILLIAVGYGATSYATHIWPFSVDSTTQTQPQDDASDNSDPSAKDEAPTSTSNKNVDATKTSNEIPQNTALTLTITDLSQDDNSINYTANLGDTSQSGSCIAEFTADGAKPVTSTTNANQGVCGPVSIPDVEFTKLGTWTLTLHYYVNDTQVIATKTIDIH